MAAAVSAVFSLHSLPTRATSNVSRERVKFNKVSLLYRNVSSGAKAVSIRAQVTTNSPAKAEKVSKKQDEGIVVNKYRPEEPYVGKCLLNTKITGDDSPEEIWHIVISTDDNGGDLKPFLSQNGIFQKFNGFFERHVEMGLTLLSNTSLPFTL